MRKPSAVPAVVMLTMLCGAESARAQGVGGLDQFDGQFPATGGILAPYFDGWYENLDGTFTFSFGYMNRNTQEIIEIPLGPNNFVEPAEFDGGQPTSFPPVRYQGYSGRRERGVFAITVPAEYRDRDVVWHLTHAGQKYSIPGRTTSTTYELGHSPMGSGSLPPVVSFDRDGPEGTGRVGIESERLVATVGDPLTLPIWAEDRGEREERYAVSMTWQKHQGPGTVVFAPASARLPIETGEGTATATFSEPGDYILRVRVDNFSARDSNFGFQCCWTNGYVPVTVRAR